jgi:hypothetical protein
MLKHTVKLAAGALWALALAAVAAAPADAHDFVSGRAGAIRNLEFNSDAQTARKIAGEFVGLIHVVSMDHETEKLYWTLLSRDRRRTLMVAEATIDEAGETILARGEIAEGALRGTQVSVIGYHDGEAFLVNLVLSAGGSEVAFTQALEPLSDPE